MLMSELANASLKNLIYLDFFCKLYILFITVSVGLYCFWRFTQKMGFINKIILYGSDKYVDKYKGKEICYKSCKLLIIVICEVTHIFILCFSLQPAIFLLTN